MPERKRGLDSLPVELLFNLLHHLSTSSLISLKLSSRQLYSKLPSPSAESLRYASRCEKRACWRYRGERKDLEHGRRRCVVCDVCATEHEFRDATPICKAHEGRLMATSMPTYLEPELKTRLGYLSTSLPPDITIWVSFERSFCVHRKLIQNWDDISKLCHCACDSCGHWPVQCYVRVQNVMQSTDLVSCQLSEDGKQVIEQQRPPPHDQLWNRADPMADTFYPKSKQHVAMPVLELNE